MSMTTPLPNGTHVASAEEVEALRLEIADLRRIVGELRGVIEEKERKAVSGWREALAGAQQRYAAMPEEEREIYEECAREARALLNE